MKQIKRILSLSLVFVMLCTTLLTTNASAANEQQLQAKALYEMGLFKGYDSTGTNFGLSDKLTREQALVFLIRMLGLDSEAMAWSGPTPYADVPADNWVAPYIGYAKEHGLTNGIGNNLFGLGRDANMQEMTVFALRGLGYSDTSSASDFNWNNCLSFAKSKGVLESSQPVTPFNRGVAVEILFGAATSNMKGKDYALLAKLIKDGAVTQKQYENAMAVVSGQTPTTPTVLADGKYTMSLMGKYVRVNSGRLEIRDTKPAQQFTVVNKEDYVYIKAEDGTYLSLSSGFKDGTQLVTSKSAFPWILKKQSNGSIVISPKSKTSMVVNACEEKSSNGTTVIVWTHSGAPKNTLITFTPASGSTAVTGIKLDQTTASIAVGKTAQLTGTISPTNATNQDVTWSSSSSSVATVSSTGLVKGVKAGTATITVKTADGSKTATCKVTVTASNKAVTGIKLDQTTATIAVGKTTQLTGTISPTDATNQDVTWSSSSSSVATVSSTGLVKGVKAGTATITVKTADGSKTATCKVTVTAASSAYTNKTVKLYNSASQNINDIRISSTQNSDWGNNLTNSPIKPNGYLSILVPVSTTDYTYDIAVIYADGSTVTFAGYNFSKFTSGGYLYAYIENGTPILNTTKPTVAKTDPTSLTLDKTTMSMAVGDTYDLTAKLLPTNSKVDLDWTSSNTSVATVGGTGIVKAVKAGTTTITVTSYNGLSATCQVTVTAGSSANTYTNKTVKFYNSVNQNIKDVRISSTQNSDWGNNLTSSAIMPNGSVSILVPVSASDYTYDIAVIYADGSTVTFEGYDFSKFTSGGALYAYIENGRPMLSTTKPTVEEDNTSKTTALKTRYTTVAKDYNKMLEKCRAAGLDKDPAIVEYLNALSTNYDTMGQFLNTSNLTTPQIEEFSKYLDDFEAVIKDVNKQLETISNSATRTVNITFLNNTDADFKDVYSSSSGRSGWGSSLYSNVPKGSSFTISFHVTSSDYLYDLMAEDFDGTQLEFRNLDLSNASGTLNCTLSLVDGSYIITQN